MKCFIFQNKEVSGPFDRPVLLKMMEDGQLHKKCQVWWKGQEHWVSTKEWMEFKPEENKVLKLAKDNIWFLEQEGKTYGPLTRVDMIAHLRGNKNYSNIRIWKRGERSRATIYQYNDLSDALGIVKRQTPRAPIVGDIIVKLENSVKKAKLCSISEGGLGMTNLDEITEGQMIQMEVESPLLNASFACEGKVRYVAASGRTGIQFESISSEAISTIVEYINQFTDNGGSTEKKAA